MIRILVLAALVGVAPAAAQSEADITHLIDRARTALNDLDYAAATRIAHQLVMLESASNRTEHITALQILAAGYYPEEREAQVPDSARVYLERLVRLWPEAVIPRNMSWSGLNDLLDATRHATFAVASTSPVVQAHGIDGGVEFEVTATQPAFFVLTVSPHDGRAPFVIDSTGPTLRSTLRAPLVRADTAVLASGTYDFIVTGWNADRTEREEIRHRADVAATELAWADSPGMFDASLLLPIRSPTHRKRNALLGIGAGVATAVIANLFRAPAPVAATPTNRWSYAVGGGIALGGLVGALVDRGAVLEDNIETNRRFRTQHDEASATAEQHNAALRRAYTATIRLTEARP